MDNNSSGFFQTDIDSIVSQIEDQDERIRLKRRWLLGLDIPDSENHTDFNESEFLPESLLREDDIFYETTKSRVEEAFGFRKEGEISKSAQQKESKLSTKDVVRKLDVYLDSLTNNGLHLVTKIVTGGSSSFEKTRWKMKQVIREWINSDFRKKKDHTGEADIVRQVHQALCDPGNFRKDCRMDPATPMFQSHRDAAVKVLNELEKLSSQTLSAMNRKLNGSRAIPQLNTNSLRRSRLMKKVRQASEKMLSELSAGDKLPEPLAKAMSLVDLSLKVSCGYKTTAATDFWHFSPETKNLQNEIVKAVWLLDINEKVVRIDELERLGLILEPEHNKPNTSLRSAVKTMLIEYLFECGDMDIIPQSLKEALSLVNGTTRDVEYKEFPREAVGEETECILNVSAQVKQIFWQCAPHYELDQDFGDAYMEELEDSEDDDDTQDDAIDPTGADHKEGGAECSVLDLGASSYTVNQRRISSYVVVRDLAESITRVQPRSLSVTPTSNKSTSVSDGHDIGTSKGERDNEKEIDNQFSSRSLFSVENIQSDDDGEQSPLKRNKNQYLAVQEICDETSLVAHNLIGRLLEKFADREGLDLKADERSYLGGKSRLQEDVEVSEEKQASSSQEKSDESIVVSVVKELMPSLDESVLLRLKELMEGSKHQQS